MSALLKLPLARLVENPLNWSRLRVGTSQRFWVSVISMMVLPFLIVLLVATGDWTLGILPAALLCWFQFKLLYGLRLLVQQADSSGIRQNEA
jgi:hypothetical protein